MTNMTPEMIQAILAAGGEDPQQAGLQRQQAMVDQMRSRGAAGPGSQVVAGRVMPNWAPALANVAGTYMAEKAQPGIDSGMKQVQQRGIDARKQYLDAMLASMRKSPQQQPQPGMLPEPGPGTDMQPGGY